MLPGAASTAHVPLPGPGPVHAHVHLGSFVSLANGPVSSQQPLPPSCTQGHQATLAGTGESSGTSLCLPRIPAVFGWVALSMPSEKRHINKENGGGSDTIRLGTVLRVHIDQGSFQSAAHTCPCHLVPELISMEKPSHSQRNSHRQDLT